MPSSSSLHVESRMSAPFHICEPPCGDHWSAPRQAGGEVLERAARSPRRPASRLRRLHGRGLLRPPPA
jgi:hypothetical protein